MAMVPRCGPKMVAVSAKTLLDFQSFPSSIARFLPDSLNRCSPISRFACRSILLPRNPSFCGGFGKPNRLLSLRFQLKGVDFGLIHTRAASGGFSNGGSAVAAAVAGGGGDHGGWGDGGSRGRGGDDNCGGGRNDRSFFSWYLMALDKHPVITKAITSALLTLLGDLICQILIDQVSKLDLWRTFVFTFLGLVLVGPTLHFWYLYLSKLVTSTGASGAFLRLLLDQLVFSPIFIGVFLSSVIALEGRPSQIKQKLQQEWFSSVLANWQLWVPFQFLNFRFVPQKFQVLAANFVALAWNVILSFKAHKEITLK